MTPEDKYQVGGYMPSRGRNYQCLSFSSRMVIWPLAHRDLRFRA